MLLKFYADSEQGWRSVNTKNTIIKVVKQLRGHHRKAQLVGQSQSSAFLCLSLPGTCLFAASCVCCSLLLKWNDQKESALNYSRLLAVCYSVLLPLKLPFVLFQMHQPFTVRGILCLECILVPVLVTRHIISIPQPACTFAVCSSVCLCVCAWACVRACVRVNKRERLLLSADRRSSSLSHTGAGRNKTLKNKLLKSIFNDR